jgi:hypothetical protein
MGIFFVKLLAVSERNSSSSVSSSSQPKFMVGSSFGKTSVERQSVPIADHQQGSALNEIRIVNSQDSGDTFGSPL